jgi:hypothetical protein
MQTLQESHVQYSSKFPAYALHAYLVVPEESCSCVHPSGAKYSQTCLVERYNLKFQPRLTDSLIKIPVGSLEGDYAWTI